MIRPHAQFQAVRILRATSRPRRVHRQVNLASLSGALSLAAAVCPRSRSCSCNVWHRISCIACAGSQRLAACRWPTSGCTGAGGTEAAAGDRQQPPERCAHQHQVRATIASRADDGKIDQTSPQRCMQTVSQHAHDASAASRLRLPRPRRTPHPSAYPPQQPPDRRARRSGKDGPIAAWRSP
jgi:hypothetical protein